MLVLGDSNSGKTYLVENGIGRSFRRVVIVTSDPNEFRGFPTRIITTDPDRVRQTLREAYEHGNVLVVVDDTDNYFTRFENEQETRNFLIMSRHRRTGWVIMARRPTDLPPLVFYQANKHFVFQADHPRELALYDGYYPVGTADIIKSLDRPAHHFMFYDRDTRDRRIAYV